MHLHGSTVFYIKRGMQIVTLYIILHNLLTTICSILNFTFYIFADW